MSDSLHIIEPTLINTAGHCYTIARSLAKANCSSRMWKLHLWTGKQTPKKLLSEQNACNHPLFSRRWRRLQIFFLMRKLLQQGDTIFLPTTSRAELAAYALIPNRIRLQGKACFYIHQMRMEGSKQARLEAIAKKIPEAHILCTTPALVEVMRSAGFQYVREQPCPFEIPDAKADASNFHHVIFPGIARMDKNLPFVRELIEELADKQQSIPFSIQAAPNHHGEYAAEVASELSRIETSGYQSLHMEKQSLEGDQYFRQFEGGICLQPYDIDEYANKISGITLDALARGCPVIVRKGIWSSDLIESYNAGISLDETNVQSWLAAIEKVVQHYAEYRNNCRNAFEDLVERHHPQRTLETIRHWE